MEHLIGQVSFDEIKIYDFDKIKIYDFQGNFQKGFSKERKDWRLPRQ